MRFSTFVIWTMNQYSGSPYGNDSSIPFLLELSGSRDVQKSVPGRTSEPSAEVFTLPEKNQTSALLSIPAELQIKIFRFLHKADGPLEPLGVLQGRYEDRETALIELRDSTQLSGQVLSVCQYLHRECFKILYRENVLSMVFRYSKVHMSSDLFVLGWEFELEHEVRGTLIYAQKAPDLVECWLPRDFQSYGGVAVGALLPVLRHMTKVQVLIITNHEDALEYLCWQIKPLLDFKRVAIKQTPYTPTGFATSQFMPFYFAPNEFAACRVFRCASFKIDLPTEDKIERAKLKAIEDEIQSDEDVSDLVGPWHQIYKICNTKLRCDEDAIWGRKEHNPFTKLGHAALRLGVDEFEKTTEETIRRVRELAERRKRDAQRFLDQASEELEHFEAAVLTTYGQQCSNLDRRIATMPNHLLSFHISLL